MENEFCYDCGVSLTGLMASDINREHIPAKCLFKGYEQQFTHDLITIRAKKNCNSSYSHFDDELRNFVAILTDGESNNSMLESTFHSIARKDQERFTRAQTGLTVSFNYDTLVRLNEKNFKGLFYHVYNVPFPNEQFRLFTITESEDRDNIKDMIRFLYGQYVKPIPNWEIAGHADVFRYKIVMLKEQGKDFVVTTNLTEAKVCICAMLYYKTVMAVTTAIRIDWAENLMKLKNDQ